VQYLVIRLALLLRHLEGTTKLLSQSRQTTSTKHKREPFRASPTIVPHLWIATTIASKMIPDPLPISPPLSTAQHTSSSSEPHQVRLRQACDACTAAKVKCDKGRPACQRCLDGDELCQYSPSRRHGKRIRRVRKSPHESPPPTATTESGHQQLRPQTAGAEYCITPQSTDSFAWDSIDPLTTVAGGIPAFPMENELDSFINGSSSDLLMWTNFDNPNYLAQSYPDSSINLPTSSTERESLKDDVMSIDTTCGQNIRHDTEHALECESRALAVLRSLQYSPTLCSPERRESFSGPSSKATVSSSLQELAYSVDSMDTLLATNKAALSELTQMLECRCAEKSHVALLHLTILSKIVFWYNVAVTTKYNSERVELKPLKIQFGVLDLDDDDYATLHRAVLSRELQKAGNALRAFELRFSTHDVPASNKGSPWGRLIIRAIREELERSVHEVETRQIKPF
jgi:hypothetical protein